jgi:GTP-binding protein EngB required for normal cell division
MGKMMGFIYISVHESNDEFKDLIRNAHCFNGMTKKKKCPKFKHKFLRKAKSQSRINLLKRIKVVVDTKTMYDQVVEGTRYVAFLGAEDVGKSTFIKVTTEEFTYYL